MVGLDNPIHILMLLVIVLLVFGAKRLPEMGRSLGSGLRGFKESINGEPAPEPRAQLSPATSDAPVRTEPERADAPVPAEHEQAETRAAA